MSEQIVLNGETYVEQTQHGPLSMVVLPRGFIFVGRVEPIHDKHGQPTGDMLIMECRNVRKWSTGGIGGLSRGAASSGAVLDDHADVIFASGSAVYISALREGWIDA